MPLTRIELRDPKVFVTQLVTERLSQTFFDTGQNDWSSGFKIQTGSGTSVGSGFLMPGYHHFTQLTIWHSRGRSTTTPTIILDPAYIAFDCMMRNQSVGWAISGEQLSTTLNSPRWLMGQPIMENGSQALYGRGAGTSRIAEYSIQNGSLLVADSFPAMPAWPLLRSTITVSATQGYWAHADFGGTNDTPDWGCIFEGITDSSGMADRTIGGTTHAKGLMLYKCDSVNLSGLGTQSRAWTWIDLATGNAVGKFAVPGSVDTAGGVNDEPPLAGQTFAWRHCQFVPDDDSERNRPKGEMHMFSSAFNIFDQTLPSPLNGATRQFVTAYDFNPFARADGIPRTHGRRVFLGQLDIPRDPIISGGRTTTESASFPTGGIALRYHQPSRTYFVLTGGSVDQLTPATYQPEVGDFAFSRYRREFVPASISQPTPTEAVESGKDVRYRSIVVTDFGDRASGVSVTATTFRVGEYDERINTRTPAPTGTYTVLEGSIDDTTTLQVWQGGLGGSLLTLTTHYTVNAPAGTITGVGTHWIAGTQYTVIYRSGGRTFVEHFGKSGNVAYVVAAGVIDDNATLAIRNGGPTGTLLTVTTHYTVNFSTGTITGVGSHFISNTRYSVLYQHRAVRLTPSHGTLLGSVVTTDSDGNAFFDVRYPSDVAGGMDEIEVTTS